MVNKKEYIICAAVHYDDGNKYEHQCKNITSGFVIAGRRHHNCIMTIAIMLGKDNYDKSLLSGKAQGFITSTDKYVTRKEAYVIALNAGQIEKRKEDKDLNEFFGLKQEDNEILISEDLYSEDIY